MLLFTLRRMVSAALLLLTVSALTYLLLALPGADVGRQILGPAAPQELVDARNAQLGLDRPLELRYLDWLASAVQGDFGTSFYTGENVASAIAIRLPVTLSLMIGTTLVVGCASVALGVWGGVRRGGVDRFLQFGIVLGYALPGFLVTLILALVFAVQLGWFPAIGYIPLSGSFTGWLSTITLPIVALSIAGTAGVTQQVRSSVIDVLDRDFVRTLRARGLPFRRVVLRHVLRNAAAPGLTTLGLQFVGLLGGAVLVEQIFGLPGIGAMTVQYTTRGDVPVIMGLVMMTVVLVLAINLLVDLCVAWLNPKARMA